MDNELQKDDFLLPGNLGNVVIGSTGQNRFITEMQRNYKDGSVTITLGQLADHVTEDAEFEEVKPKQLPDVIRQEIGE